MVNVSAKVESNYMDMKSKESHLIYLLCDTSAKDLLLQAYNDGEMALNGTEDDDKHGRCSTTRLAYRNFNRM